MSSQNLSRKINLLQASAINVIDMVGIGPFVVIPLVISFFNSNLFLFAWIFGAVVALVDGMIWAELGAKYPLAGGTYNFHRVAFGERGGKLMSFLFVWQTSLQAPLVAASAAIGFAQYLKYLVPGNYYHEIVAAGVIIAVTLLLYRRIEAIGKISVILGAIVILTILWIVVSGFSHKTVGYSPSPERFRDFFKLSFWMAMGQASVKTVYSYLGYYNVCHLGGEIVRPEKNIPRSIFISIFIVGALYILMNIGLVSVIPWQRAQHSYFIVSIFFETIYGPTVAKVATALVLLAAVSSLFALLLGYSRVPYAAAVDGNFFKVFSKLHPTKNFPYISLLFMAGLAIVFSISFSLHQTISAILAMRIIIQFIGQAVGVVLLRRQFGTGSLPFKMWLYPLPILLSIGVWLFILISTGWFALWGLVIALTGIAVYLIKGRIFQKL